MFVMLSQLLRFDPEHMHEFGKNANRFMLWGVVLMILGVLAVSFATFSTIITVALLGFFLFVSGLITLADTFSFWWRKWSGFFAHLFFALLYIGVGLMLLNNPIEGSFSIALLLGFFYIFIGASRIGYAAMVKTPKWGWNLFNGIIALTLGCMITFSWPESSLFIIGLFVGIDLFFTGWAYFMAALAAKNLLK